MKRETRFAWADNPNAPGALRSAEREHAYASTSPESTRVRTYYLRIPTASANWRGLPVLAVGIVFAFVVGLAGTLLPIAWAFRNRQDPPNWCFVVATIGAVAAPVGWVFAWAAFRHARLMSRTKLRTERLSTLRTYERTMHRLPQRLVEHCLRQRYVGARRIGRCLRSHVPGRTFVILRRDGESFVPPGPLEISFEPISTLEADERTAFVSGQHALHDDEESEAYGDGAKHRPGHRTMREWVQGVARVTMALIGVAYFAITLVRVFQNPIERIIGLVLLLLLGAVALVPLFWQRRWWIVPGGLVFREDRFWNRQARWGRITPSDSPFLMDWRMETGYVVHKGRVLSLKCNEMTNWLAVAAWMSTSPPPTIESVRAFLELD